jgi:hypothetical protein
VSPYEEIDRLEERLRRAEEAAEREKARADLAEKCLALSGERIKRLRRGLSLFVGGIRVARIERGEE